jgi:hypothetical protein
MLWKFFVISFLSVELTVSALLSVSNDEVVIEAIRENRNLLILFCKSNILCVGISGNNKKKYFQLKKAASTASTSRVWFR